MKLLVKLITGLALSVTAFAGPMSIDEVQQLFDDVRYADTTVRVEHISSKLLGTPYQLDGFGEGPNDNYERDLRYYDQDPRYRFDAFDCTTLVETVTAFALSSNLEDFKSLIDRIRYKNAEVSYVTRNHFPSLDWVPNNIAAGFYEDITATVAQEAGIAVATAEAIVDKRTWYSKKKITDLNVPETDLKKLKKRLAQLQREGRAFKKTLATLPYLKLTDIFSDAHASALNVIPSGAVINIVRPGWSLRDKKTNELITQMNVSHQGFAIWKNGVLYFREASSRTMVVQEVPLKDYLAEFLESPTIKGINVLQIK